MRTDKIFYALFKAYPSIFFELIGEINIDASAYDFASIELKETACRIDGVLVPSLESPSQPVFFLEVQFQSDLEFYRRFFGEIFIYLRQNLSVNHWRAIAVFRERNLEPDDLEAYRRLLIDNPQVQRVYLDELGEGADNSLTLGMIQLIVESEETAVELGKKLISQARQELTEVLTQQGILDTIETILLYKFSNLSREEIQEMLGLDDFKESRLYQDIKQEGLEEGKLQGKQEGKQEGLEEGEMKAKLESVPRLLGLGLTAEQVAVGLGLTVEQVQQAIQNQSN